MMIFKVLDKEYQIKFGYEATLKSGILSKMARLEDEAGGDKISVADEINGVENILLFIPEMLLVGLQRFHKEEFGYVYETEEGKDEQLSKIYGLIDDYFDEDEDSEGAVGLYRALQDEMLENGFLAKMFRKEKGKAEQNKISMKKQAAESKS